MRGRSLLAVLGAWGFALLGGALTVWLAPLIPVVPVAVYAQGPITRGSPFIQTGPATIRTVVSHLNTVEVGLGNSGRFTRGVVGHAHVNTTAVGNVGSGEDDLMAYPLPHNTLSANGKAVRVRTWGTFAANGNTKTVRFYFGATSVLLANVTQSGGGFEADATVVRTGTSAQEAIVRGGTFTSGGGGAAAGTDRAAPSEDTTASITIKVTGSATSNDDIVQRGMTVEVLN